MRIHNNWRNILLSRILVLTLAVFLFAVGFTSGASDGRTIKADDILERIQARDRVEYDGVTISGDLDIDRLEQLPTEKEDNRYWMPYEGLSSNKKSVESLIRITNSTIRGRVNFNNTIFHKSVDFNCTKFEGHAGFMGVHFRKARNWSNVIFSQYADFLGSEFKGSVTFEDAKFLEYADFG